MARDFINQMKKSKELTPLLELKYRGVSDAARELGGIARIRDTFIGFQDICMWMRSDAWRVCEGGVRQQRILVCLELPAVPKCFHSIVPIYIPLDGP
jgi:hypothetical protein